MNKIDTSEGTLAEELPYWDFVNDPRPHIVLNDGSLVTGFRSGLIDIECFDESRTNQLCLGLRGVLNSISEGVNLQFFFSVSSDFRDFIQKHCDGKDPKSHELIQKIAKYRESKLMEALNQGSLYKPELIVFLKTKMSRPKKVGLFKRDEIFASLTNEAYSESLEVLFQNLDTVISSFNSLGLEGIALKGENYLDLIYRFFNPKRSLDNPTPNIFSPKEADLDRDLVKDQSWLASQSPREQLVFGDLLIESSHFVLDTFKHKVITLKTLPEFTFAGQLSQFLRMPFHFDLILSFDVPKQAEEMAKLNQRRKMAHSLAITSGNRASDIESETKLSSTEELIRELLNSGQRIYAGQLMIILRAPNDHEGTKKLNREAREVLSRFQNLQGAEAMEETVGAWKVLKGQFPGAPISQERARKYKTNNLADFIPVYGPREGDKDPVVVFRNRLNGLVGFDPFDPKLNSYNSLVTGSSGAGKSFLNNCILLQEFTRGQRVFIIDIGGSYKKITESLGGQYLEVNLKEEYRLNPFDIPNVNDGPTNQKIKSLLAVIESMVVEDSKSKLSKLDRSILEKHIIELYSEKRSSGQIPILSDLAKMLSDSLEPSMKDLSKILYMWTGDRPYGNLLDCQGTLKTNAPICTFDLKGLSNHPDLQSVMILILTDFIITQVEEDKSCKKRIIMDEAWQLLQSPVAVGVMEYCVRTLRKAGAGITFITQGIEEIVNSPIGPAILNNTPTKFIMLQKGDSSVLKKALNLNERELDLIYSLEQRKGEFSEGFMIEGEHRQVIRIYPSPFEYWLSTSDADDNSYLNQLISKGKDLVSAITAAAEVYPQGVKGQVVR